MGVNVFVVCSSSWLVQLVHGTLLVLQCCQNHADQGLLKLPLAGRSQLVDDIIDDLLLGCCCCLAAAVDLGECQASEAKSMRQRLRLSLLHPANGLYGLMQQGWHSDDHQPLVEIQHIFPLKRGDQKALSRGTSGRRVGVLVPVPTLLSTKELCG